MRACSAVGRGSRRRRAAGEGRGVGLTLPPFSLQSPGELADAFDLLERYGDAAALYMGGTELLLILKLGLTSYDVLVDGKRLRELRGLARADGELRVGAATTHRELESAALVREVLPALASLAAHVGNPRVRNVGTLGGNLCFAEPHSDPATLLVALGATVDAASAEGSRGIRLGEFFAGPLDTALGPREILTQVRIPLPTGVVAFERIAFHERPVANAAVHVSGGQTRVVVGAVGGKPERVPAAEDLVREGESADVVVEAVMAAVEPYEDQYGSADYKRHLAGVAVRRCLRKLATGA